MPAHDPRATKEVPERLTIYVSRGLCTQLRIAGARARKSLSGIVEEALTQHLSDRKGLAETQGASLPTG